MKSLGSAILILGENRPFLAKRLRNRWGPLLVNSAESFDNLGQLLDEAVLNVTFEWALEIRGRVRVGL